ncbi:unnamed protein product [Schistosoma margrebowiei]|uniref:Uncharacterized protein n=1 Tax=Schistosoma margrebowiei TaxID=48269 RepID=A0A183LMB9_9TREM|nr:unnamed protein product [Schistosoma margrebowiei]
MKTSGEKRGIQWTARMQLDDLDFADDLALLSQLQQQMQEKTIRAAAASTTVGLNIHKAKSEILRYNTACTNSITIDREDLEDLKTFTYLGSIVDEHGRSDADVKARIGKARAAYLQPNNIWNSKQLSTNTKQQPTVRENKPDPNGGRNQEEALEVDKTHVEKRSQRHHKTSPHIEYLLPNEKRKTKEHITPRNGDGHEKNEQYWIELERKAEDRVGWRMLVGGLRSIVSNRHNQSLYSSILDSTNANLLSSWTTYKTEDLEDDSFYD